MRKEVKNAAGNAHQLPRPMLNSVLLGLHGLSSLAGQAEESEFE
jgi:hypothetical protein